MKSGTLLLPETLLTIPHLMLSYTDRERLSKENMDSIKRSGMTFRGKGKWPLLEEYVPGFTPVLPEGNVLWELPYLLDEVANVLLRAKDNPGYLYREGDPYHAILVRTPSENSVRLKWEDRYVTLDTEWTGRGFRPKKVEIRSEQLFGLLQGVLNVAYCSPERVDQMPQLDEAFDSLVDHLNSNSSF
jgi:hypothetical protein